MGFEEWLLLWRGKAYIIIEYDVRRMAAFENVTIRKRWNMYSIAICDDETAELDKTQESLKDYMKQNSISDCEIERFENAEELLYLMKHNDYMPDIFLLDIYMPEKLGTTLAREIRDMGSTSRIIFLTSSKDHALEAFRLEAAQYLVKPVVEAELFAVLDRCFRDIEDEAKKYLLFKVDGKIRRILLGDILYCEAQGKRQYLYFADGTHLVLNMTMGEVGNLVLDYPEFTKVGISYIINMNHLDTLNAREAHLDNGDSIYLPRGSYGALRESYFRYYCGGGGGRECDGG